MVEYGQKSMTIVFILAWNRNQILTRVKMMTAISSDRRDEIEYWFWQCNNLILFIPSHFFLLTFFLISYIERFSNVSKTFFKMVDEVQDGREWY